MKICFKKGDLPDVLVWLITIFILAMGLFVFAFVIPTIGTGLNDAGMNSSIEGADAITTFSSIGTVTIQRGFFMLFAGLIMGVMISSFLIRTHPIFMFLYVIFLGLAVFLSTYFGNAYETLTEQAIFSGTLASQGLINVVMNNIPKITLGVGALSIIIVFAKFSSLRGGGQDI